MVIGVWLQFLAVHSEHYVESGFLKIEGNVLTEFLKRTHRRISMLCHGYFYRYSVSRDSYVKANKWHLQIYLVKVFKESLVHGIFMRSRLQYT